MADKKKTGDNVTAAAKLLGARGGKIGGVARAKALSPEERRAISVKGGEAKRDGRAAGVGNMSKMVKKPTPKKKDK